ncbi:protein IQ-DOMAIN 1 [Morus notabilis]|uniref:protein IQ-DOMAIN 1 n=1 Tax=Morus notabilis TaxID=981085 RepID=UPI000CED7C1D|nr:protein IQ-DOMAIN 1 [Morus notabilis]XP_024029272.1 protein IQ-DOMAIN 1 [Morus notabilis]
MGSGNWFKTVFRLKKVKVGSKPVKESSALAKSNGVKVKNNTRKGSSSLLNGSLNMPIEDVAAIRIQTAFRAYKARKALRRLKGILRLQILTQGYPVQKQSTTTLNLLHSWCNLQMQIRARRLCMVTEGRIKQKKLENQQKLEAKLHDIEVEWCAGSETMDEVLSRIYQREEAAVKRERAMAYAFSHQWRANCSQSQGLGNDELGKANWGWSWKERWIAARPWESRVAPQFTSPKKDQSKQANKAVKTPKTPISVKPPSSNGKEATKARRLSFPSSEKVGAKVESNRSRRLSFPSSEKLIANEEIIKLEEAETKKEELVF